MPHTSTLFKILPLTLFICCICAAQTKINPNSQINWPLATGLAAPTATCTSTNYGQPYTDTATNTPYTCSAAGWLAALTQLTVLPITSGGTGATTAPAALANLGALPTAGGTMTGALNLDIPLSLSNGGTGATTASTALANLGALPTAGGTMTGPIAFSGSGTAPQTLVNLGALPTAGGTMTGALNGTTATFTNINSPVIEKTVYVDQTCTYAGTYDQSCLANAVAGYGSNTRYVMSAHTYLFSSSVALSSMSNFIIEGQGAGTVLQTTATSNVPSIITCTTCSNFVFRNFNIRAGVTPTIVTTAQLPSAATYLVIDRFGSGNGYIPGANDVDIIPTSSGGSCVSGCLTAAQSTQSWDTSLAITSSNNFEITGITTNYASIVMYDSSYWDAHDNNIMGGGRDSLSGLYCWKTSSVSAGCHHGIFHGNIVKDATYSGIMVGGGDHFEINNNDVSYNGESGIKTYQNSPNQNSFVSIVANGSSYNWFDGFDLGSTYPHTSTFDAHSNATGNNSDYNHGTGYYGDGLDWTFVGNTATYNFNDGMGLDFCNSVVSSNTSIGNNTGNAPTGVSQLAVAGNVSCGNNTVEGNITNTAGNVGYGLYAVATASSLILSNQELTTSSDIGPTMKSHANSAGAILYPDSAILFSSGGISFAHAGTTTLVPASAPGGFTLTLPASTATIAVTSQLPQVGTPASSSAACTPPTIQYDSLYLYVCASTNSWRRVALSTF